MFPLIDLLTLVVLFIKKWMGLLLRKKTSFKVNWGSYTVSIAKIVSKTASSGSG